MNTPSITVSYNGSEKRVALSVHPSLELTDSQVENAEGELYSLLRRLFNVVDSSLAFYLHEVETGRVMSRESFRQPSYCQNFPTHWYMVLENYPANRDTTSFQVTIGKGAGRVCVCVR